MPNTDGDMQFTFNGLTFQVLEGKEQKDKGPSLHDVIEKYYDKILSRLANAAKSTRESVRDVLHDVLLQELEKEALGRGKTDIAKPVSYLKTAALRELWRIRREEKRLVPLSKLGDVAVEKVLERTSREPDPLEALADRTLACLAAERLERLPLRQRHVLTLWCSGLDIPEIAERAKTTPANVRFHKYAAIQALRETFGIARQETA